jgi:hypothetical protein
MTSTALISSLLLLLALQAPVTPALASSGCSSITPWVHKLREQMDRLKVDHPRVVAMICADLVIAPTSDGNALVAPLNGEFARCGTTALPLCNEAVSEMVDVVGRIAALQAYAVTERCAVPSLPSPC